MGYIHKPLFAAGMVLLGLAVSATAQTEDAGADDPSHSAGRISVVQGEVNVNRGDSGESVAAVLNAPVMADDHLQTADGSRSEVQFDSGNLVRLAPQTDLGFPVVAHGRYQLQLAAGTVIYRIDRDTRADVEIDTPSIAVHPRGVGIYRVSVSGEGTTSVTVREGRAEIFSPKGSQTVNARETMLARGSSSDPEFQLVSEIAPDQFDDWSNNRDRDYFATSSPPVQASDPQPQEASSPQPQYVPPDVAGAQDLNAYGSWVPSAYGTVWAPRVAATWAPYQYGRWVWSGYYGWTWVDYDPWGWAPFHYGRWFWNTGRWCWWPGSVGHPYYWRPALVGFFGFGSGGVGFGVGFGFGNVGWVALAPHEVYHPWYGHGFYGGYNRTVVNTTVVNNTLIHNTNIYNTYRNAGVNHSVAYVGSNNFGRGGQPLYWAGKGQLQQASLVRGQLPVAPERKSLAFSSQSAASMPRHFAAAQNQRFFTHQQPPSISRASFSQQQQEMAHLQERVLGVRPNFNAAHGGMESGMQPPSRTQSAAQGMNASQWSAVQKTAQVERPSNFAQDGWHRVGQQPSTMQSTQGQPTQGGTNRAQFQQGQANVDSGWHRFGDPGASSSLRTGSRVGNELNDNGGWHTFGSPGVHQQTRVQSNFQSDRVSVQSNAGHFSEPMRLNPPIVNDRSTSSAPRYNGQQRFQQQQRIGQPHYSAPQHFEQQRSVTPHYQPPQHIDAPHNSAPSDNGHSGGNHGGGHGKQR